MQSVTITYGLGTPGPGIPGPQGLASSLAVLYAKPSEMLVYNLLLNSVSQLSLPKLGLSTTLYLERDLAS